MVQCRPCLTGGAGVPAAEAAVSHRRAAGADRPHTLQLSRAYLTPIHLIPASASRSKSEKSFIWILQQIHFNLSSEGDSRVYGHVRVAGGLHHVLRALAGRGRAGVDRRGAERAAPRRAQRARHLLQGPQTDSSQRTV